jgi:hypothetical protein
VRLGSKGGRRTEGQQRKRVWSSRPSSENHREGTVWACVASLGGV